MTTNPPTEPNHFSGKLIGKIPVHGDGKFGDSATVNMLTEPRETVSDKADENLVMFRSESLSEWARYGKMPTVAEVSMDLYESLLKVDFGMKEKPRLIGELFGIKIMIDPMLKENEIKWRFK